MTAQFENLDPRLSRGFGGLFFGVYTAVVTDVGDPDGQGRVKIQLPWSPDNDGDVYDVWARLATLMAGNNRGSWFIPDKDDEVLVSFEAGDTRRPYVIGSLWNGKDEPPESMDGDKKNDIKTLRSRNGVIIKFDDTNSGETLTLETPGGNHIVLKDGPGEIDVKHSNGDSVKLENSGITINSSGIVKVNGSLIEIKAGMVTVDAGLSRFSGVVQADTVISNSVISASYTPGAGNIW